MAILVRRFQDAFLAKPNQQAKLLLQTTTTTMSMLLDELNCWHLVQTCKRFNRLTDLWIDGHHLQWNERIDKAEISEWSCNSNVDTN